MAVSRTKATILGGAVGGPIGALLVSGQAHWKANQFVQAVSNPFTKSVGSVIDPFVAASKAGTLTYEQAQKASDDLEALFSDYQWSSDYFASLGKDQAKVVKQGWDTVNPYIASWRNTVGSELTRLKPPDAAPDANAVSDVAPTMPADALKKATGAAEQQRKRALAAGGRRSTILTGPGGLKSSAGGERRTILGY